MTKIRIQKDHRLDIGDIVKADPTTGMVSKVPNVPGDTFKITSYTNKFFNAEITHRRMPSLEYAGIDYMADEYNLTIGQAIDFAIEEKAELVSKCGYTIHKRNGDVVVTKGNEQVLFGMVVSKLIAGLKFKRLTHQSINLKGLLSKLNMTKEELQEVLNNDSENT